MEDTNKDDDWNAYKATSGHIKTQTATLYIVVAFIVPCILAAAGYIISKDYFDSTTRAYKSQISDLEEGISQKDEQITTFLEIKRKTELEIESKEVNGFVKYIMRRKTNTPIETAQLIATTAYNRCRSENISFDLIVGLMEKESTFDLSATSKKIGAKGLMQIRSEIWAEELKIENPDDLYGIVLNINSGIEIFKTYLNAMEGNITKALMAYNGTNKFDFPLAVYTNVGRFVAFKTSN